MIAVIKRSTAPQNAANTTTNASASTSAAPKVVSRLFFGAPASVRPICFSITINSFPSASPNGSCSGADEPRRVDQRHYGSKDEVLGASPIWVILGVAWALLGGR